MCSGLAGLLFLFYPDTFPKHSTLEGVMLIGAFLGAAFQRLADVLIFKPFLYYASLIQLRLLRQYIGEKTQNEIIRQLTRMYFLGYYQQGYPPPKPKTPAKR